MTEIALLDTIGAEYLPRSSYKTRKFHMKGLFPEFESCVEHNFESLWTDAWFIFDTSVLLNLYRYKVETRDELLNVIESLTSRIWIPHQVALEFQRNRLSVIADQKKRYSEVRKVVIDNQKQLQASLDKLQLHKRHSVISTNQLLDSIESAVQTFLNEISDLEANQQSLTGRDPLKERIESLFEKRVGPPPASQAELDLMYKEAERRFLLSIPPGYLDDGKDSKGTDEYTHGKLIYRRKFGDLLAWKQILHFAKKNNHTSIVLIIDDGKEDWWRKIHDDSGPKTIGPRTELLEEARLEGGVENLLLYRSEELLKHANNYSSVQVSKEAIQEVRDVSSFAQTPETVNIPSMTTDLSLEILFAAQKFLSIPAKSFTYGDDGFVTFIGNEAQESLAFIVDIFMQPRVPIRAQVLATLLRAKTLAENGVYSKCFVLFASDDINTLEVLNKIGTAAFPYRTWGRRLTVFLARVVQDQSNLQVIIPFNSFDA